MKFYLLLFVSILLEVFGVFFLNYANGFTVFIPTLLALLFYVSSIYVYIIITSDRDVGSINAIFAGSGTALVAIIGIVMLNESFSLIKIIGIGLIMLGVMLINFKFTEKIK